MELFYICNGFLLALNVYTAFFFLSTTMKTKPYREALGWLSLVGALLVLSDIQLSLHHSWNNLQMIKVYTVKDFLVLPFYVLELSCLLEQEAEKKTWKERWILLLLSEVPFVLFVLLAVIVNGIWWVNTMSAVYAIGYMLYNMVRIAHKLRVYEKAYIRDPHYKGDKPFTWIKVVFSLHVAFFVVYGVVENLGFDVYLFSYTVLFSIILMVTTYYVNKQLPLKIDFNIQDVPVADGNAEVSDAAMDENENDEDMEKRRKRVNMQLYMDQFLLKHPQYERRLVSSTNKKLTRRDIYLCMLIVDGCNIETLARNLSIGVKSVEVARSRLRAKLNLTTEQSLKKYLQDLL